MNEQKIEDLKNALREIVKMISQRSGPIPEDLKLLLVKVMEHVATRIQQLRSEEAPVQQPEVTLQPSPHPSSQINSFKYDPKTGKLLVKFMGKDSADSGPIYGYDKVPSFIYDIFSRGAVGPKTTGSNKYHAWKKGVTPSLGAAMNALIKAGNYNYTRIS